MIVCEETKCTLLAINWSSEVLKYKIQPVMNFSDKDLEPDVIYYFDRYVRQIIVNESTFKKLDLSRGYLSNIVCADTYKEPLTIKPNEFKNLKKYCL